MYDESGRGTNNAGFRKRVRLRGFPFGALSSFERLAYTKTKRPVRRKGSPAGKLAARCRRLSLRSERNEWRIVPCESGTRRAGTKTHKEQRLVLPRESGCAVRVSGTFKAIQRARNPQERARLACRMPVPYTRSRRLGNSWREKMFPASFQTFRPRRRCTPPRRSGSVLRRDCVSGQCSGWEADALPRAPAVAGTSRRACGFRTRRSGGRST